MPLELASALPKQIEEIGAIAGIVSFVLMLTLLGLYIARALELRKLRRTMRRSWSTPARTRKQLDNELTFLVVRVAGREDLPFGRHSGILPRPAGAGWSLCSRPHESLGPDGG
jgi:hypothetical protein